MLTPRTVPQQQQTSTTSAGRLSPRTLRAVTGQAAKVAPVAALTAEVTRPTPTSKRSTIPLTAGTSGTSPEVSSQVTGSVSRRGSGANTTGISNKLGANLKRIFDTFSNTAASPKQAAIDFGGFEFPTPDLTPPPPPISRASFSSGPTAVAPASLKEGGFVRKKT